MSLSSDSSLSPPLPPSHEFHFPVLAIALIAIVATGVLLISYYIFVIKCCLNLHRVDVFNRLFSSRRRSNLDSDTTSASATPSPGLDEAVIRSIPVIKFRKSSVTRKSSSDDNSNSNSNSNSNNNEAEIECAVCLCEFEEGEKLRVIPNCCHAFHIDCIDIWLQNSSNCPLCRTGISASSMLYNPDVLKNYRGKNNNSKSGNSSSISSSRSGNYDNFSGDEDDYLVIEIQGNNLDEPKLIDRTNSLRQNEEKFEEVSKKLGRVCSIGDELIESMRIKDEEFHVQPVRRSMSMDLSINRDFCVEMQEYCRSSNIDIEVNRGINCDSSSNSNSKVRKSIFSFGYGRSSKGSVQPTSLDI